MVDLRSVDICCELSMMSSHLALLCEGHLKELLYIFAYLRKYHDSEMVFDPSYTVVDEDSLKRNIRLHLNLVYKLRKNCL